MELSWGEMKGNTAITSLRNQHIRDLLTMFDVVLEDVENDVACCERHVRLGVVKLADQCCGSNKTSENKEESCCSSSVKANAKQESSSCCSSDKDLVNSFKSIPVMIEGKTSCCRDHFNEGEVK